MDAGSIVVKVGVDATGMKSGLNEASKGLKDWKGDAENATKSTELLSASTLKLIGITAAAGAASYALVQQYGSMADNLNDLSYQTGVTTEKLQQMQYAAVLTGTNFGVVENNLNKMILSMEDAKTKSTPAYRAFMGLGVDPSGKTPAQVFDEISNAMVTMQDETQRNSYAMDIFGRSYKELLPYMEGYVKNAKEIQNSPVYSQKELDDLEAAKISWDKLTNSFTVYTGKTIGFITDIQNKVNNANPLLKLLFPGQYTGSGVGGGLDAYSGMVEQSRSVSMLTDEYAGLTDQQIDLNDSYKRRDELIEKIKTDSAEAFKDDTRELAKLNNHIKDVTESMKRMAETSVTSAKTVSSAWGDNAVVGAAGSQMQIFMQREMEMGTSYQDALTKWGKGEPTSSIPGQDTLGAVKAAGVSSPGTSTLTAQVISENTKQADSYKTLNESIKTGYSDIETAALQHYTTLDALSLVHAQAEQDRIVGLVNLAGEHPIVQNKIIMSATGPDWTPPTFVPLEVEGLKAADFSSVKISGSSASTGTTKNDVTVNVAVKVDKNGNATATADSTTTAFQQAGMGG